MKNERLYYRTGQFAKISGVTTRTLRYYDRIGLLKPSEISDSGQRLYSEDDIVRLQQIVTLKFIGFSLQQIKNITEMKDINLLAQLSLQREWMEEKLARMQMVIQALKETERVFEQTKEECSETMKSIIGVIEMETNKDWLNEFLTAAVSSNQEKDRTILAANKEISQSSIHAAAVLGEIEIVRDMLMQDVTLAKQKGGPENGEPLLYLCFSCFLKNSQNNEKFEDTAKILLEHGADPNAYFVQKGDPDKRKLSALYAVIGMAGNASVAKILLEAGANPNDGESLYHAAELPSHECMELLYQYGVDINSTPALFRKLDFDDYFGVKWFLDHGSDPNLTFGEHGTPLHWAVIRGRSPSIIELLIKSGTKVNTKRSDGKTAYMLATRYGRTELVEVLRANGAATNVDSIDNFFGACAVSNKEAVKQILQNEPDLLSTIANNDLKMLLEFAEINNAEAINLMLESGFDSSLEKEEGTALHIAAWFGHIETVRVLIAHGTSLSKLNTFGGSPLDSAIHGSIHSPIQRKGSYAAVVDALIKAGATVPKKSSGSKEVYEVLCRYGALK